MKPARLLSRAIPGLLLLLLLAGTAWYVAVTEAKRAAGRRADYENHVRSLVAWLPEGLAALADRVEECRRAADSPGTRPVDLLAELALRGHAARRDLDELLRRADNLAAPAGLEGAHAALRHTLTLARSAEVELLDHLARPDPARLDAARRALGAALELSRRLRDELR